MHFRTTVTCTSAYCDVRDAAIASSKISDQLQAVG